MSLLPYVVSLVIAGLLTVMPAEAPSQDKVILRLSSPQPEAFHSFSVRRGLQMRWEVSHGTLHVMLRQVDRNLTLVQATVHGPGHGTSSLGQPGFYVLQVEGDGEWMVTVSDAP